MNYFVVSVVFELYSSTMVEDERREEKLYFIDIHEFKIRLKFEKIV